MTIMTADGRRCDSTCQLARCKECHCVCGGKFHGAGLRPGGVRALMLAEMAANAGDLSPNGVDGEDYRV